MHCAHENADGALSELSDATRVRQEKRDLGLTQMQKASPCENKWKGLHFRLQRVGVGGCAELCSDATHDASSVKQNPNPINKKQTLIRKRLV